MADADDIDRLILELHSSVQPAPSPGAGDTARLERWLRLLAARDGSDLLLVAGAPPSLRVDSKVIPLAEGPLDGVDIEEAVLPALAPHARRQYLDVRIADGSFRISDVGRFRINLHRERGYGEEVHGNHLADMIVQECLPGLAGRPWPLPENAGDGALGNLDAEHLQLAVNPRCAP